MPDPFREVRPGDRIDFNAVTYNAMVGAGKAFRDGRLGQSSGALTTTRSSALVRVQNDSGHDVDRNGVLSLDGPVFLPSDSEDAFLREVLFSGITPDSAHRGRFCVTLEPIPTGRVGRAWVAGVCQVRVDVIDVDHRRADAIDGDRTRLRSSDHGAAAILWKEDDDSSYYGYYGLGDQWAIVQLGSPVTEIVYGVAPGGGIPARSGNTLGSATVTVYSKSGASIYNTGQTATCYNGSSTAVGGSKVVGMWPRHDGTYDAILESC